MLLARGQQARVNTCDVAPPEDMVDVVARKMLYMARARLSPSRGRGVRTHLFSVTVGWGIIAEKHSSLPLCPLVASCAERCVDDRRRLTDKDKRALCLSEAFFLFVSVYCSGDCCATSLAGAVCLFCARGSRVDIH